MKKLLGLVLGMGLLALTTPAFANCNATSGTPALQAGTQPCSMDLNGNLRVLESGGTSATPTVVAGATTSTPASITNPLPVNTTPSVSFATCASSTIVTGGASQTVITQNTIVHGALINNPSTATEPLFINPITSATTTASGSNLSIAPGVTFFVPGPTSLTVSGTSTTSTHPFTCFRW